MLFNSLIFLAFGACFFLIWPLARERNWGRWSFLCAASLFFYGWWNWRFIFLILANALLNFAAGILIHRQPGRRTFFLALGIIGNVSLLALFKYSGFIADNLSVLLSLAGFNLSLRESLPHFITVLPIGISFFTFMGMSYLIDIHRGKVEPASNFLHLLAYLSLFPHLIAGPIVRSKDLLDQLTEKPRAGDSLRWNGLRLIVHGYFKKMVIADNLAPAVNDAFGSALPEASSIYWAAVILMFTFQIYCDFSGYSDIARGLANWMGYEFPLNFDHPYISTSLREFWRRWHMSLSFWFRDYVYIPLGGSRTSAAREHVNLWITMLVCGLWHGAAWTFVIWGGLHALFISVERLTSWPRRVKSLAGGKCLAALLTMVQVAAAWVFFRSETLDQALVVLGRISDFSQHSLKPLLDANMKNGLVFLAIAAGREFYFLAGLDRGWKQIVERFPLLSPLILAAMICACVFLRGHGGEFIYFQF